MSSCLKVPSDPEQVPSADVVGSKAWISAREGDKRGGDAAAEADQSITISAECEFSVKWKCYSASVGGSKKGSFVNTILPRYSVPGCAVHCGTAPLFGVSYSCMEIRGMNKRKMICNGVTLFPPGCVWITLALLCLGSDPYSVLPGSKFPDNESLDIQKLDLVDEVYQLMSDHRDELTYNPILVEYLLDIFDDAD